MSCWVENTHYWCHIQSSDKPQAFRSCILVFGFEHANDILILNILCPEPVSVSRGASRNVRFQIYILLMDSLGPLSTQQSWNCPYMPLQSLYGTPAPSKVLSLQVLQRCYVTCGNQSNQTGLVALFLSAVTSCCSWTWEGTRNHRVKNYLTWEGTRNLTARNDLTWAGTRIYTVGNSWIWAGTSNHTTLNRWRWEGTRNHTVGSY